MAAGQLIAAEIGQTRETDIQQIQMALGKHERFSFF